MQTQHSFSNFKIAPALGAAMLASLFALHHPVQAAPATVTSAVMATGFIDSNNPNKADKPTGVSTVFKPSNRTIYAMFNLSHPVKGYGRSVWYAIKAEGIPANAQVAEVKTKTFPNFQFGKMSIANNIDWPRGSFKVALYVNTTLVKTLFFSVK